MASLSLVAALAPAGAALPTLANGATARLDFLDVGPGGEATLLRLPSGVTALVNGRPDGTSLAAALARRPPFYQRSLDLLVLTDPRGGDARGLEDATGRFGVAQAADAGMLHPTSEYIAWLDALKRHGATGAQIRQGDANRYTGTAGDRPGDGATAAGRRHQRASRDGDADGASERQHARARRRGSRQRAECAHHADDHIWLHLATGRRTRLDTWRIMKVQRRRICGALSGKERRVYGTHPRCAHRVLSH